MLMICVDHLECLFCFSLKDRLCKNKSGRFEMVVGFVFVRWSFVVYVVSFFGRGLVVWFLCWMDMMVRLFFSQENGRGWFRHHESSFCSNGC